MTKDKLIDAIEEILDEGQADGLAPTETLESVYKIIQDERKSPEDEEE